MNNLLFIIFLLSAAAIGIFIILAILEFIKKNKPRGIKQIKFAGISAAVMIVSLIAFTATSDPVNEKTEEVAVEDEQPEPEEEPEEEVKPVTEEPKKEVSAPVVVEKPKAEKPIESKPKPEPVKKEINTSVYEYASNIDITDARDLNDHITLMIDMKTDNEGMAFQHVLNQTYDFVQQPDIEGAKTIGINVRVKGDKVGMFTIYPEKFKANDDEPMADAVLAASDLEMVNAEVEQFGKVMELW
ncbi:MULTISPECIES: hypothetical protein [unclassified Sporosarcina]|uniref:hypothetical protein n=1 Tax=unclassified Sporosarcina TaxID=2647733 RepID=UPI00203DD1F4|nr:MULTISPECIES: hypothetical protein [unclassified Sporosarcina]GKV66709.1 hypothetical protein NCCP2331_28620 [Sporosarcina sp. NCCP-2331]GLB57108.1 hypothetical protein NCCP2378_28950 [Sporosarcina sp. NCCP-2378]